MPAYLSDGNAAIYNPSHHVIDFDPSSFGIPSDKHFPLDGSTIQPAARPDTTNASFDDTSSSTASSSSHSDLSDASQSIPMNGHRTRTRQTSMSSVSNGQPVLPGLGVEQKPTISMVNGTTTLVDRTVTSAKHQQPLATAVYPEPRDHSTEYYPDEAGPETTTPTLAAAPFPTDASSTYSHQQAPYRPVPNSTASSTVSAARRSPSLYPPTNVVTPASPTSPPPPVPTASLDLPTPRTSDTAHRLSYPPHHNASSSSPTLSTSQVPGPGQLRQRHTLEVPRKQSRVSRDGADAAFASGRFSPTAPGGPGPAASVRRASLSLARRATRSIQSDLPRDEVAPDEDALRWAEAYRQKRATKKRRREEEDDDRVLVGTKVDEHHVNWVTAYNMLTGIRVSVSRTNAKLDRDLTDADFEAKQKSTFDM